MDDAAFQRLKRRVQRLYEKPDDGAFTAAMDKAAAYCTDEQWQEIEALSSPRHNDEPALSSTGALDDKAPIKEWEIENMGRIAIHHASDGRWRAFIYDTEQRLIADKWFDTLNAALAWVRDWQ